MAACGSLRHIFDKPLETPTAPFDSIPSWKHLSPIKSIDDSSSSFADMFSELHFMEKTDSVLPTTSNNVDKATTKDYISTNQTKHYQCNVGMNAESLSMCTEGLGFESFIDVEDLKNEEGINDQCKQQERRRCFDTTTKHAVSEILPGEPKRSRISGMEFPPPISSIGVSGKPWVCLKSYRNNGRFILKEVRIPTQELLHACREDGRLKLQFIQSEDEAIYEEDEAEEIENGDEVSNDYLKVDHNDDAAGKKMR